MYRGHNTRLMAIDARLLELGFEMDFDLGSIPGEGHLLLRLSDGELVSLDDETAADLSEETLALAKEWSELVDECSE